MGQIWEINFWAETEFSESTTVKIMNSISRLNLAILSSVFVKIVALDTKLDLSPDLSHALLNLDLSLRTESHPMSFKECENLGKNLVFDRLFYIFLKASEWLTHFSKDNHKKIQIPENYIIISRSFILEIVHLKIDDSDL